MSRELLLLGLLRRSDMHGYQLSEFIARDLAVCTAIKKPTAYFLLAKMAEQGWINQEEDREGNRPVRHVFRIQPDGETEFQERLRQNLATYQPVYFDGDMGIAFLEQLPVHEALVMLRQRRQEMSLALEEVRRAPAHKGGFGLVIEHRIHHLSSELDWLDQLIAHLEQQTS